MHPDRVTGVNRLPVTCATVTRRCPGRPFLERPECRVRPPFLPPYAPHPNPIRRLWGAMRRITGSTRTCADSPGRFPLFRRNPATGLGEDSEVRHRQFSDHQP